MEKEIGVFEAKNKLSALVNSVREEGKEYIILHRGKPAARLVPLTPAHDVQKARQAIAEIRELRKAAHTEQNPVRLAELMKFRDEGRDRWVNDYLDSVKSSFVKPSSDK
ncbi:MAG: type II toxin-antitoxin system prevent-host-death family antitoxin [Alphaproteobacteria bacterium]|nr:type II toxin-antitoxin system prevent-host-death family antitoxin [Alphaproteobacteria bacterium]